MIQQSIVAFDAVCNLMLCGACCTRALGAASTPYAYCNTVLHAHHLFSRVRIVSIQILVNPKDTDTSPRNPKESYPSVCTTTTTSESSQRSTCCLASNYTRNSPYRRPVYTSTLRDRLVSDLHAQEAVVN